MDLSFHFARINIVQLLGDMVNVCLIFKKLLNYHSKQLYHFIFMPPMCKSTVSPHPHQKLPWQFIFLIFAFLVVV